MRIARAGLFTSVAICALTVTPITEAAQAFLQDFNNFPSYPYNTGAYKDPTTGFVGCGPTTGAMIFGYFENSKGAAGLLTTPGIGVNQGLATANALHSATYMNTSNNGFGSQYDIKGGLEGYAANRGYVVDVMMHVGTNFLPSNATWNAYGAYGDAWNNDGGFWDNSGPSTVIDKQKFVDFVKPYLAMGIAIFLTIDNDAAEGGDHWVPLVAVDDQTLQYGYYDTYDQALHWANIQYITETPGGGDQAIAMLRTVEYVGPTNHTPEPGTLLLVGASLLGMAGRRFVRR
jgi:hypothetical protein